MLPANDSPVGLAAHRQPAPVASMRDRDGRIDQEGQQVTVSEIAENLAAQVQLESHTTTDEALIWAALGAFVRQMERDALDYEPEVLSA